MSGINSVSAQSNVAGSYNGLEKISNIESYSRVALRASLTAATIFAISKLGTAPLITGALCFLASSPAAGAAGGCYLGYFGVMKVVASLTSGLFSQFALGALMTYLSYEIARISVIATKYGKAEEKGFLETMLFQKFHPNVQHA